jgi:hypothetical protein
MTIVRSGTISFFKGKLLFFPIMLSLLACDSEHSGFGIDLDGLPAQVVLEGLLVDGRIAQFRVGKTGPVLTDTLSYRINDDDLSVEINQNGVFWQSLYLDTEFDQRFGEEAGVPMSNAQYRSAEILDLIPGQDYQVIIRASGLPTAYSPLMRYTPPLPIDSLRIEASRGQNPAGQCRIMEFSIRGEDASPLDEYYYVGTFDSVREKQAPTIEQGFDDSPSLINHTYRDLYWSCNTRNLIIEVVSTEQRYFEYQEAKRRNFKENLGGVFATPDPLPHNIEGGFGYVGLGTSYRIPFPD